MIKKFTIALFLCLPFAVQAQYLETFTGQNGKGLVDAICPAGTTNISNCGSICTVNAMDNTSTCTTVPPSFSGVDWAIGLGPSATYFTDPGGFGFENDFALSDFGVVSDQFQIDDPDNEICWLSPELNIASAGAVSIAIDVSQAGGLESSDYIRGDYSLNGGGFNTFETQSGAFAPTQLNASGLTGTTLSIRVCALTNGTGEQIFFDNVSVPQSGVTTGCNAPMVSLQTTQAGSCNGTNGTIKVTASGGTPGYNVAWSGPSSGNPGGTEIASSGGMYTITALTPGTYTITVTDAASCTATTTASITTATAMSLGTQVLNTTCSTVNDGEIDLSVSNGVPPYSYSWSNLPGPGDPQDQTGLAAGTYTVTVTDNAGCTASTSATVAVGTPSAYLETFSIAGKGILDGSTCSGSNGTSCTNNNFAGVNWSIYGLSTLSGVDANDYFKTTGGKLEHKDIDQDVCWESPEIDINPPGSGIAFSVDLAWFSFDQEPSPDYIDVEYSIDGGGWTRAPNAVGGSATHTIGYANGAGNDLNGSTTLTVTGLSGNTLRIRICGLGNSEDEIFTIDNVSVPGSNGLYCPCPTITFTATPTNTCSGSSNGQIAVTGVTGGTGPYMYSKDNGANFQSGATFTGLAAGMYDIVVKDDNGCESAATQVTVGTFSLPVASCPADLTVCSGDAAFTLTGGSPGGGTYSGMGVSGGMFDPATAGTGPHTITYVYTDGNGCSDDCTFTITVLASPLVFNITGGGSYCSGGPGVEIGLSGSEIGAEYALFLDGNFLFSLFGTGNPLSFGLQTAAGTYQSLAITNVICQVPMSGTATVTVQSCIVEFSGKIVWEDDDVSGVKDATVNVTGSDTGSDLTDINGDYSVVTTVTTGNFTLKPVKNINKFNGVTAGDATAIQQHVTLINPITDPYKQVCADVNKSNSISTLDASLVVQALLGNPAANAIFNTSWRFVPSSYALSVPPWGFPEQRTYTGISGPQTDQDFVGMKIGDVTGSANPANFGSEPPLVLRTTDAVLQAGETFDLIFNADQKKDLAAFQFALNFDPAQLQFLNVEPLSALPLTADQFGLYQVDAGEIRAVWSQATGQDLGERAPLFRLQFQVLQSGAKVSEVLRLDDSILPGLSYTGTLSESGVQLKYAETSGIDPVESLAAKLQLQNRPNPFKQATTISFVLPEATEAQLRIFDAGGRLVWERNKAFAAGYNEAEVQLDGASGVLVYELVTPFGTVTNRMVRVGN